MIGDIKKKCADKVRNFKEMWEDDRKKHLFDNKNKLAVEKMTDKNPMTTYLELKMSYYRAMIQEFEEIPVYRNAFFIQVNFAKVISKFKNEAHEWLEKHGKVLRTLGLRELQSIQQEISVFKEKLAEEPPRIEELKILLNTIAEIKDMTMMTEFRIFDVQERFRTLQMYHIQVEQGKAEEAQELDVQWKDLVHEACLKDHMLSEVK